MRKESRLLAAFVVSLSLLPACSPEQELGDAENEAFLIGGKADALVNPELASAVLALVNAADFAKLDDEVGLDRRAAENIVAYRRGPDQLDATNDDNLFDDLAELDAVKWVGPRAFGKLSDFVLAEGLVEDTGPCVLISEYIEGAGQYNKAIELFNCGSAPVDLATVSLCMVRNDEGECSITSDLGSATLLPGEVTVVCRRQSFHPASLDPIPVLAQACELERPSVMTFNGDDRLLVLDEAGAVLDSLGRVGYRPLDYPWADLVLDRCNPKRADGVSFYDHNEYFRSLGRSSVHNFGVPPTLDCQ